MGLDEITSELIAARPYFKDISPRANYLLSGWPRRVIFYGMRARRYYAHLREYPEGTAVATYAGSIFGDFLLDIAKVPLKTQVVKAHISVQQNNGLNGFRHKNGLGGHSWITKPGRYDMVIVFHDANRAGPHIDVHIGRLSVVYRVKPDLYAQLKYNKDGMLTEKSKDAIIAHIQSEIANGSRVPQNLDHSKANARAAWTGGDPEARTYGSGRTRQVVLETQVDVLKAHADGPIEFYAPALNSYATMYLFRLYKGTSKRAPILVWGNKVHHHPKFEDRLHLKLVHPEDADKLAGKADMSTSTAKYDGSSCYFVTTPKGTTVWSPRISKVTGDRIEYTFKVDGVAQVTSNETVIGMGELLFKSKKTGEYLPSPAISGLLNSNNLVPTDVVPEIRVYRIDKIGRTNTSGLGFWENRKLQEEFSRKSPRHFKVVELMGPEQAKEKGFEGFVAVPEGKSVNEGFKTKWWQDEQDWRIDEVRFIPGPTGKVAGVVHLTSLESGKTFKLGPGQIGNEELTRKMMADPGNYTGTVLKVRSRHGHEGRAAKVLQIHDDKGTGAN